MRKGELTWDTLIPLMVMLAAVAFGLWFLLTKGNALGNSSIPGQDNAPKLDTNPVFVALPIVFRAFSSMIRRKL